MRKIFLISVLIFFLASWNFAGDFSVNLNINYNAGTSDFFKKSEIPLIFQGLNFLETTHNKLGIGFNLSCNVPLKNRLYLVPGFSIVLGHQSYKYTQVDEGSTGENDSSTTSFFKIYSGELNLLYDVLVLKNGWFVNALLGLNYNNFKADVEMRADDEKYWGMMAGLGAKFYQLKHLGFQVLGFYKIAFGDERFSFVGIQSGLSYRF